MSMFIEVVLLQQAIWKILFLIMFLTDPIWKFLKV